MYLLPGIFYPVVVIAGFVILCSFILIAVRVFYADRNNRALKFPDSQYSGSNVNSGSTTWNYVFQWLSSSSPVADMIVTRGITARDIPDLQRQDIPLDDAKLTHARDLLANVNYNIAHHVPVVITAMVYLFIALLLWLDMGAFMRSDGVQSTYAPWIGWVVIAATASAAAVYMMGAIDRTRIIVTSFVAALVPAFILFGCLTPDGAQWLSLAFALFTYIVLGVIMWHFFAGYGALWEPLMPADWLNMTLDKARDGRLLAFANLVVLYVILGVKMIICAVGPEYGNIITGPPLALIGQYVLDLVYLIIGLCILSALSRRSYEYLEMGYAKAAYPSVFGDIFAESGYAGTSPNAIFRQSGAHHYGHYAHHGGYSHHGHVKPNAAAGRPLVPAASHSPATHAQAFRSPYGNGRHAHTVY